MAKAQTKKRLSYEERRDVVLAAARKVFMEQGYGGASMRPIAAEAGITEAMLYRISPSKQELFEDAVAGPLEEAVQRAVDLSLSAADDTDLDDIRARCRAFAEGLIVAMQDIAPLLMAVLMTDDKSGKQFYQQRFEPALMRIVETVKSHDAFWRDRNLDPELIIKTAFGTYWFLALDTRFGSGKDRAVDLLADQITNLFFDGISVPK